MCEEIFDLYSADRRPLNKVGKRGATFLSGEYHLAVMGILVNGNNELLITRRSENKPGAGKWECTAGSVLAGENTKQAIIREIKEEIGVNVEVHDRDLIGYFFEEDAIFDIWKIAVSFTIEDLVLQRSEVDAARYLKLDELENFVRLNPCTSSLLEAARLHSRDLL